MAIRSFSDKRLENLFVKGSVKALPASSVSKIERLLDLLDAASSEEDLRHVAGYHRLSGNRKGYSVWIVTRNWRLTFRFVNADAHDVDFEDYH
jgi:proteic killer suppression protein